MNRLLISLFILNLLALSACKREEFSTVYPEMNGVWKHYTAEKDFYYLELFTADYGYIMRYRNNVFYQDTQPRKWFIKNGFLCFGRWSPKDEKFRIDSLPQTAVSDFTHEFDTVQTGDRYMWLDNQLYVDKN